MAVPWLAVGKLVLSNLDTVMGVVSPAFTRKRDAAAASQAELVNQQIAELQSAAATNAVQIKELATQLRQVVTALDEAALAVAAEREATRRLCWIALGVSVISLACALIAIFVR
jgi:hypothetical protein